MGRISKIVTKAGDQGQTGLADGIRVKKNSLPIQVIGDVDELNSHLGLVISLQPPESVSNVLLQIQHQLFAVGEELSSSNSIRITEREIAMLEGQIDASSKKLPSLNGFILPGGTLIAAQIQVARSICRRAERSLVALNEQKTVSPALLCYLNRLSDLLFILAQETNLSAGCQETFLEK